MKCVICAKCSPPVLHAVTGGIHCRQDNNPLHDLSVEPSSRARMHYHNHLKFCLYSIMKNLKIILRGAKLRFSEAKKWKLPKCCLHAFSWDPLSALERTICHSKEIFKAI